MTNRFTRNLKDPETDNWSGREIWYRVRGGLAVLLSLGVLGGGGYIAYTQVHNLWASSQLVDDYDGTTGGAAVEVTIPTGTSLTGVGELLVQADVVKTTNAFTKALNASPEAKINAGKYKLKTQVPASVALSMLLDKANEIHNRITLVEGKRLTELITTMSKATGIEKKEFNSLLLKKPDQKKLGLPSWFKKSVDTAEGFVFPDTYEMPEKPTALGIIKESTKRFNTIAKELSLEEKAEEVSKAEGLKISAFDLVTVASIIEREVNRDEDRPLVARVIYNRLKKKEKLGMDSTTAYAVNKQTYALTQADIDNPSPYNTRKVKGLPPGPIANPGKAALEAAANPGDGDKLYFFVVTDPSTGETEFAETSAEFVALKAKYEAWCNESDEHKKVCGIS